MSTAEIAAKPSPQSLQRRAIAAITVGNALEFYDFIVYSALATMMGGLFFPFKDDPLLSLLASFGVFGVGFIVRPLGGILIGLYADRHGRRSALRLTLWLMAIGSALLVVAPTYAQWGIIGPIVVIIARLIQGFAVGGQVGAATTMLMEYADKNTRGYYCSWQLLSQHAGVLGGTLMVALLTVVLTEEAMRDWGWRLIFAVGVLTIPVGEYIRHKLEETVGERKDETESPSSVEGRLFKLHIKEIIAGVLICIGSTAPTFIVGHYMANHAVGVLGIPLKEAIWAASIAAIIQVILATHAGRLSDRLGRRKVMLYSRVLLMIMIYPAFWLIHQYPTINTLLITVAVLSLPLIYAVVPGITVLPELFPRRIRASGMSIVYCLGVMVFGGFAQFISVGLIKLTNNPLSPAFYLIACLAISLIGIAMIKETAGKELD